MLLRIDVRLPETRRALVARELRVGLQPDLAAEWGLDLTLITGSAGEERAAELGLDEELRVEPVGRGVEGRARDGSVDCESVSEVHIQSMRCR